MSITFDKITNGYAVVACDASATAVTIPDTYAGEPVTAIGDFAFADCAVLASVDMGANLTAIGAWAFKDCTALARVNLSRVTDVDEGAFYDCASLAGTLALPMVARIGDFAFFGCDALTGVSLPKTAVCGGDSFPQMCVLTYTAGSPAPAPAAVPAPATDALAEDRLTVETYEDGWKLTACRVDDIADVVLPDTYAGKPILCLGKRLFFENMTLTRLVLGNHVRVIETEAISHCKNLSELVLPDSLTEIGRAAFHECRALTDISFSTSVRKIDAYAFAKTGIAKLTLPDGVQFVGDHAFDDCPKLSGVSVHCATEVGVRAFGVPFSFEVRGDSRDDSPYRLFLRAGSYRLYGLKRGCVAFTECKLPDTAEDGLPITQIGEYAFQGCEDLVYVTLGENIRSIEDGAFRECPNLREITIPAIKPLAGIDLSEVRTKIGAAFSGCKQLTELHVPDGYTDIGKFCCFGCSALTRVTLPDTVITIPEHAFANCTSLTSVTMSPATRWIDKNAFSGCTALTELIVPADCNVRDDALPATCKIIRM